MPAPGKFSPPQESGSPAASKAADRNETLTTPSAHGSAIGVVGHVVQLTDAVVRIEAGRKQNTVAASLDPRSGGDFSCSRAHSATVGGAATKA